MSLKNINYFLFLAVLFTSCAGIGQNENEEIKNDFDVYISAIQDKDYDQAIAYTDPSIFQIVSKDQLKQSFAAAVNTPGMEVIIGDAEITEIKDMQERDSITYKNFEYKQNIKMRFDREQMASKDQTQEAFVNQIKGLMAAQFGEENVSYDQNTQYFTIINKKRSLAEKKETDEHWYFMTLEKGNEASIKQLLPESVYQELYP